MASPQSDTVKVLIEKAGTTVGSEYKLAKLLNVTPQRLSSWKLGRQPCVPADRARLAGFANEDPVQELVRATLEQTAGTPRGNQLQTLLGKSSRQIGAATSTVLLAIGSATFGADYLIRCIKRLNPNQSFPSAV